MDKLLNPQTINFNYSACIKELHNIGSTTYYNICSDTHTLVPWGSLDWIGGLVGVAFGSLAVVLLVGATVGFLAMAIKETYASI